MFPMSREEGHRDKAPVTDLSLSTIQDQLAQLVTTMAWLSDKPDDAVERLDDGLQYWKVDEALALKGAH
jgi:hypothetical protein